MWYGAEGFRTKTKFWPFLGPRPGRHIATFAANFINYYDYYEGYEHWYDPHFGYPEGRCYADLDLAMGVAHDLEIWPGLAVQGPVGPSLRRIRDRRVSWQKADPPIKLAFSEVAALWVLSSLFRCGMMSSPRMKATVGLMASGNSSCFAHPVILEHYCTIFLAFRSQL